MSFGNMQYAPYVAVITLMVLGAYIWHLAWKRRVMENALRDQRMRRAIFRGNTVFIRLKTALVIVAIALSGFLLLRPQWGEITREAHNEGADLLIALDVSRSMLARDVRPDRLSRAKDAIRMMAERPAAGRIGLILFAGTAYMQCPLTSDVDAFLMFLESAGTDSIRMQGTDIGGALGAAAGVFRMPRMTSRMLVLITDGEDHEGGVGDALRQLKKLDVAVYTVGVGTTGGDVIPEAVDGVESPVRDDGGTIVRTRKNSGVLEKIARETGGGHLDITHSLADVSRLLGAVSGQQKRDLGTHVIREKRERYQIFALVLILLMMLELLLPERGSFPGITLRRAFPRRASVPDNASGEARAAGAGHGRIFSIVLCAVLLCTTAWLDPYHDEVAKGNEQYRRGDFKGAGGHYDAAARYAPRGKRGNKLNFNRGDARYMDGEYDGALRDFEKALNSGDDDVRKKAYFNMGNALLKKGDTEAAVRSYINALKIDPGYMPAKKNIEYVLQSKNNDGGAGNARGGSGDEKRKEHDRSSGKRTDAGDASRREGGRQKEGAALSKDQAMNILKAMKQKPVRRQGDGGDARREREKSW